MAAPSSLQVIGEGRPGHISRTYTANAAAILLGTSPPMNCKLCQCHARKSCPEGCFPADESLCSRCYDNLLKNENLLESNDKPQHGPGSRCPIEFCPQCEKLDNA